MVQEGGQQRSRKQEGCTQFPRRPSYGNDYRKDLLVGLLGIPFAVMASVGLPRNLYACLFTVSLLVVLCTISIFCLVAVSVDRYWAILYPMGYSRNVRTRTAIGIICVCWVSGTLVGFLPLLGWHNGDGSDVVCFFTQVMDYNYLVFLYFATIIAPAIVLAGFYAHIYRVVLKQLRQIVTMNPGGGGCSRPGAGGGTMLRMLGAARKREVKATQNLSIIVLFFIICWIPLYTINCVQAFCDWCAIPLELTNFCIILSHLNSAINPLLYAYHLRDFRAALKALLCCIFTAKAETGATEGPAGRFGSQHTLHHQGIATPSRNNSIQSLQQVRLQQSQYSESTTVTTKLSSINSSINTIISSMSTIASLPLGEDLDDHKRKRMWTLTEVPSVCEEDSVVSATNNGEAGVELRGEARGRQARGEWTSSGQVNSAFIEEGVNLDYDEDDDDDVFIPEGIATLSVRDLNQHNRASVTSVRSQNTDITGDKPQSKLSVRENSTSARDPNDGSVSDENFFPKQSNDRVFDEIERSNRAVDDNDKTELAKSAKKPLIVSCDSRNCDKSEENKNTERVNSSNESNTSQLSQRLSPLKIVGEFLFPSNNRKVNKFKEESSMDSCKDSVTTIEAVFDNNSAVHDTMEDSDSVQNNGCALHTSDKTLNGNDQSIPK